MRGMELVRQTASDSEERHSAAETDRADTCPTVDVFPAFDLPTGGKVGRYVVLEEIGRGGMGRVVRAYDPKLQREVALKEVGGKALGEEGSRRLVREARAMARLSHPNVVPVYDVEERDDDGLVIVMEYVAGETLRSWLRREERGWQDALACLRNAGRGLAAAHAAGLRHRDFKPANVLVGDGGDVKVTDFGLARGADESQVSSSDLLAVDTDPDGDSLTRSGMLVGTPRYMAPEQHRGGTLTAAADQYAFCVTLWEALCGAPPFSGKKLAKQKLRGPPQWPNPQVPRVVVDACIRGLDPSPEARWPDMASLLAVLALEEPARRSRWVLALGGLAAVGLGGAGVQAWAAAAPDDRCTGAEDRAKGIWDDARRSELRTAMLAVDAPYVGAAWERAERGLDEYAAGWIGMHTEACEATAVRGEQSAPVMDLRMSCLDRALVGLDAVTEVLAGADGDVVRQSDELLDGLPPLSRCADVEALLADVEPPLASETKAVGEVRALVSRAKAQTDAGQYEVAQGHLAAAEALLADITYEPLRIDVALQTGSTLHRLGKYPESEAALLRALDSALRWEQWEQVQQASSQLLFVVGGLQQRPEGLRYRENALGLVRGDARLEASVRNNIALTLDFAFGKYPEAEAEFRHALALKETTLGPDHLSIGRTRGNLASVLQAQGRYDEAEVEHRAALELRERILGAAHPDVASSRNGLAIVLYLRGQYEEAEAEHRRALALRLESLGATHPDVAESHSNLAVVLFEQGRYADAEAQHRKALALRERVLGPKHPEVAKSINNVASTLYSLEKYDEAVEWFRRALELRREILGDDHPDVATGRNNLAHVLLKLDRATEALPLAEQAWERRRRDGISPGRQADTAFVLARSVWEAEPGDPAAQSRARLLAQLAIDKYAEAGESDGNGAQRARAWLEDSRDSLQ